MIRFTCPGCRWQHLANVAFVGYVARCVRCGVQLAIPEQSSAAAPPPEGRARPRAERVPVEVAPPPEARRPVEVAFEDELLDEVADEPAGVDLEDVDAPPARARSARPTDAAPVEDAGEEPGADRRPPPPRHPETPNARVVKTLTTWWANPRRRVALIAAPVVLVGAVIAIVLLTGEKPKPKPPPPSTPSAPPVETKPEPPPPTPTPKKVAPPPPPPPPLPKAPYPHDPRPDAPYQLSAAAFFQAHSDDPARCEQGFAGKVIEVRGVCRARTAESVAVGDGTEGANERRLECEFHPTSGPPAALQPGDPVTVRGTYARGLKLTGCWVASTEAPADELYKGHRLRLAGVVTAAPGAGPGLGVRPMIEGLGAPPEVVLAAPWTDARVTIRCLLQSAQYDQVRRLKPGDQVVLQGECAGRTFRTVRLDDCLLLTPAEADELPAGVVSLTAAQLTADYESDLIPAERPGPTAEPIQCTPGLLAAAFQTDPHAANLAYRNRWVQLSGRIIFRDPKFQTVTFETGTGSKYRVTAAFLPDRFEDLPPTATVVVRGVCSGGAGQNFIRVENAEPVDLDPTGGRTEFDHFPFRPGKELVYDYLQPTRAKDNPIRRVRVWFAGSDQIRSAPVRYGHFPDATLFADPPGRPRWTIDWSKSRQPETVYQYRVRGEFVEVFHPVHYQGLSPVPVSGSTPAPGTVPAPATTVSYWDPVLKVGLKKGRSWSIDPPDGSRVTYTVRSFGQLANRPVVEIVRVAEHPKLPDSREETTIVLARGVGEVRRVTKTKAPSGVMVVASEEQLVEGAELRADPSAAPDSTGRP